MKYFLLLISFNLFAATPKYVEEKIKYRTSFGNCPTQSVGRLTLELIKAFEQKKSLYDVKQKIVDEKLDEKYFISQYNVKYSPVENMLKFNYDCPEPLMKVQIYKKGGEEFYTALLVDNGELYDPTYEVLLRAEKKIKSELPYLALPVALINDTFHKKITSIMNEMTKEFRSKISEVILNEKKELTFILSVTNKPSSVFMGSEYWSEKVKKLQEIIAYMSSKEKIPTIINLTNHKKIVVKFSDTI